MKVKRCVRIFAQATPRSKLSDDLQKQARNIIEHLAKLYCFPECRAKKTWRNHIYKALNEIDTLKQSKRRPQPEFILENSWDHVKDGADLWPSRVIEEAEDEGFNEYIREIDVVEFCKIAESYYSWLAGRLNAVGLVTPAQVYGKLEELGL